MVKCENTENVLSIDSVLTIRRGNRFPTFQSAVAYMNRHIPATEPTVFVFLPGFYVFQPVFFQDRQIYLQSLSSNSVILQGVLHFTDCVFSINELDFNLGRIIVDFTQSKSASFYITNVQFSTNGFVGFNNYDSLIEVHVPTLDEGITIMGKFDNIDFSLPNNYFPQNATILIDVSPNCLAKTVVQLYDITGYINNDQPFLLTRNLTELFLSGWETVQTEGRAEANTLSLFQTIDQITIQNCNFTKPSGNCIFISSFDLDINFVNIKVFMKNSFVNGVLYLEKTFFDLSFLQCSFAYDDDFCVRNQGNFGYFLTFRSCNFLSNFGYGILNQKTDLFLLDCKLKTGIIGIVTDQTDIYLDGLTADCNDNCVLGNESNLNVQNSTIGTNSTAFKLTPTQFCNVNGTVVSRSRQVLELGSSPFFVQISQSNFSATEVILSSNSTEPIQAKIFASNFTGYKVLAESVVADFTITGTTTTNTFQGQKTSGFATYKVP